jgi:hypothetical protein
MARTRDREERTMSYEFQGISYSTVEDALAAVATAWIYGGRERPYPETLDEAPEDLAANCIEEWHLGELLAEWCECAAALADAMEIVIEAARAETGAP